MNRRYRVLPAVLAALVYSGTATAIAGNDARQLVWFSSESSNQLNRSSVALARGYLQRGIHLARAALDRDLSVTDSLIAVHNLCIGYLLSGEVAAARDYCAQAFFMSQTGYTVKKIRGANRLQANGASGRPLDRLSALGVLIGNMQQQSTAPLVSQLVQY